MKLIVTFPTIKERHATNRGNPRQGRLSHYYPQNVQKHLFPEFRWRRQYKDSSLANTQVCYANLNKSAKYVDQAKRHSVLPVRCKRDRCSVGMSRSVDRHNLQAPSPKVKQSKKSDGNSHMPSYNGNRVGLTLGGLGIQFYIIYYYTFCNGEEAYIL